MIDRAAILIVALTLSSVAAADDARARENYMLHCQGCHLPAAEGVPGRVPRMQSFLGYFLQLDAGREFVIRVPGVATAQLTDVEVAELMNWLISVYSADEAPPDFRPFTAAEVAALRRQPEPDPLRRRDEILDALARARPALAAVLADNR